MCRRKTTALTCIECLFTAEDLYMHYINTCTHKQKLSACQHEERNYVSRDLLLRQREWEIFLSIIMLDVRYLWNFYRIIFSMIAKGNFGNCHETGFCIHCWFFYSSKLGRLNIRHYAWEWYHEEDDDLNSEAESSQQIDDVRRGIKCDWSCNSDWLQYVPHLAFFVCCFILVVS